MKKLLSMALALIMTMALAVPAFALESSNNPSQQLSDPEWDYLTIGDDYYIDENGNVIYTYEREEKITGFYSDGQTRGREPVDFLAKYTFGYDSKTKNLIFYVNIDCPSHLIIKPNISIAMELKKGNTKYGSYTTVVPKTEPQKVGYLTNYSVEYPGTNHYKFTIYLTSNDPNLTISTPSATDYSCRNRTGNLWGFYYTDPNSHVSISEPPTNWAENQQQRPSNLNKTYQNNYNATYGTNIVVGSDVGIDVHHVRPLQYGGSNNMSNLIHIDHNFHQQITGWFRGY